MYKFCFYYLLLLITTLKNFSGILQKCLKCSEHKYIDDFFKNIFYISFWRFRWIYMLPNLLGKFPFKCVFLLIKFFGEFRILLLLTLRFYFYYLSLFTKFKKLSIPKFFFSNFHNIFSYLLVKFGNISLKLWPGQAPITLFSFR